MILSARDRGQDAEQACCRYLQQQGLKLLARNYHGRRGELLDGGETEVRYREWRQPGRDGPDQRHQRVRTASISPVSRPT